MRNRDRMKERNTDIKNMYDKLSKEMTKTSKPVPKYNHVAILNMIADKFYLQPDYIQNIICRPDDDFNPNQLDMFKADE